LSPSTVRDSYLAVDESLHSASPTPSGEHLLMDIEGVDGEFLNSEERLTKAMVQTVTEVGLTMLSYHCHSLLPSGVSCVGVLPESHISFHTWPEDGVITLDLFTFSDVSLLPKISIVERLFGVGAKPRAKWSHELRGFQAEDSREKIYINDQSDLSLWVLSPLELHSKKQVYTGQTDYQRIDIWDIVEVSLYYVVLDKSDMDNHVLLLLLLLLPLLFCMYIYLIFCVAGQRFSKPLGCTKAQLDSW
jgi:S-adenosylmethionine decarboxylase proenzyme